MEQQHAKDVLTFVEDQANKETLRFITCGSVDDGKSTLIGRLLYESKNIFDDQLQALESDSKRYGTQGEKMDMALLVDGLQAEREQGITIDVAYRFFSTEKRRFIVADTPGHEQYTRNMATGASTADVAVILVDARKGILVQTRRHSRIVSLMGIKQVVLAVNKMDLVSYDQKVFDAIVADYTAFAAEFKFDSIMAIPVSGLDGDNVLECTENLAWFKGPSLIHHLEQVPISLAADRGDFRLPVQLVNRPNLDFRGFCGRIAEGAVRPGDAVRVLPSGVRATVKAVIDGFDEVEVAKVGSS
ncbi:MAG: GTP-binding protein, partial [Flavobacteriales bacterium]